MSNDSSCYCYYSTIQRPTAVSATAVGNFTDANQKNLVVARHTTLTIYLLTPEGLRHLSDIKINGDITAINLFRSPNATKDYLFVLTRKFNAMILEAIFDGVRIDLVTMAHGDVSDRAFRPCEHPPVSIVEPKGRFIGLRLYDGYFKIIPLSFLSQLKKSEDEPSSSAASSVKAELSCFNIRCEEHHVVDMQFLRCTTASFPVLALIHHEQQQFRHFKSLQINIDEKEATNWTLRKETIDCDTNILFPCRRGGVILIGSETITYLWNETSMTIMPPTIRAAPILCWCAIDDKRYLLGDQLGRLLLLSIIGDAADSIEKLELEVLGSCSIAKCIEYLDNGVVFIGSCFGNSQLIKLNDWKDATGSYFQVIDQYNNIGPIIDMVLVDPGRQGQSQLITCSGAFTNGTLRLIRQGVGIEDLASVDLVGIKNMWSISYQSDATHNVIVLSFIGHTKFLFLVGEEVEEKQIDGLVNDERTLFCGMLIDESKAIVQITESKIYLLREGERESVTWSPPENRLITVTCCNGKQILCTTGHMLHCLAISGVEGIELLTSREMPHEVACVDASLGDRMCAVGLWGSMNALLLKMPSLDIFHEEQLNTDVIPRSILLVEFCSVSYLLVSLGDGSLIYFRFNPTFLSASVSNILLDRKKVILGNQPLTLRLFRHKNEDKVFAISDRPTVIYSSSQKLVFASVNIEGDLVAVCGLSSYDDVESLVYATSAGMTIGVVNEIQKLHMTQILLRELPSKIAYHEATNTFAVITQRQIYPSDCEVVSASLVAQNVVSHSLSKQLASEDVPMSSSSAAAAGGGPDGDSALREMMAVANAGAPVGSILHSLLLFDLNTVEILYAFHLNISEVALSIATIGPCYVIGTAIEDDDEEPKKGFIRVLLFSRGKLELLCSREMSGAVFQLSALYDNRLMATVNSDTIILTFDFEKRELQEECKQANQVISLHAKARNDYVIVGDIMRSMTLLSYNKQEGSIQEIARDCHPAWMTGIEMLSNDTFIGAEHMHNLFVVQYDSSNSSADEESLPQLKNVGCFHGGDFVNVFHRGQLGMRHFSDSSIQIRNPVLIGGVYGSIAMICQLEARVFILLQQLESVLRGKMQSPGHINHEFWRTFQNERTSMPALSFVDGDLLDEFLGLNRTEQIELAKGIEIELSDGTKRPAEADDLVRILDELANFS